MKHSDLPSYLPEFAATDLDQEQDAAMGMFAEVCLLILGVGAAAVIGWLWLAGVLLLGD